MLLSLEVKSILHHATEASHMWINTFVNSYFSSWLFRSHKNITIVTAHKPTPPLVGNVFWSGRCPLCNFGGAPTREDWRRLIMSGADPRFLKRGWLSWWFQIPPRKMSQIENWIQIQNCNTRPKYCDVINYNRKECLPFISVLLFRFFF